MEAPVRPLRSDKRAQVAKGFFADSMRPYRMQLAVGILLTFLLGLVAAPIPMLLGPALQVIADPNAQALPMSDLFGSIAGPWLTQWSGRDELSAAELMAILPLSICLAALLKAGIGAAQWFLFELIGEQVARVMRQELVTSYLKLDPNYRRLDAGHTHEAELSSAVTNDVRMVREFFVHYYGGMPRELLQTSVLTVWLYILSPKLFLIFIVGLVPLGAVLSRVSKKLRRRAQQALQDFSQLSEWLQQRLLGIETIKHYGSEQIECNKMQHLNDELRKRFMRAARVKARTSPMIEGLATIACAIVLIIALQDVASGDASGAAQLSFFSTIGILSQSASKLGRYLNSNREGAAALRRLATLRSDLARATMATIEVPGDVATRPSVYCDRLGVRYENSKADALRDFTYRFESGRIYCLVGPSGAGKSTLFNLLLGLLRPTSGELRFAAEAGLTHAERISYLPQKVQLVPGSLAENVAYPLAQFDSVRVEEALERVGMKPFVASLPGGIAEVIGEGGRMLSGGQAQRVLLARLWYRAAPVVLVDEGTSALDPEVEVLVFSLLRALAQKGSVVIMIAHRMAAAAIAERLLLLDAGVLAAEGEPAMVMASKSFKNALH